MIPRTRLTITFHLNCLSFSYVWLKLHNADAKFEGKFVPVQSIKSY